jgi:DNA-binding beta-propeller fold protein YncE
MSRNSKFAKVAAIVLTHVALASVQADTADTNYDLKPINLPGAHGVVALDYFAYDRATRKVWVPASNLGSVDVIDEKTDAVSRVSGFATGEIERRGKKITVGPTAASIGDGVVYIGNRGDRTVCLINVNTLRRGECVPVSADPVTPDGVAYVAATKELWVTTRPAPGGSVEAAKSLQVFDASDPAHLKWKTKIPLDGLAEGYAVDNSRGLFYTNVEDTGTTAVIDLRSRKIVAKWNVGNTDLQGLALDTARKFLFVACGNHVVNIDAHEGKVLDSIKTGTGLDNIDYSAEKKLLYAAASQAARLTIAEVGDDGKFHLKATVPTVRGARGVVAASDETAYLIDPVEGRILKLSSK